MAGLSSGQGSRSSSSSTTVSNNNNNQAAVKQETTPLARLQSYHKALVLELDLLHKMLSKSAAQHGHAKYHRRTRQLHTLLTKRYCVTEIAPVATQVSKQMAQLAKDMKNKQRQHRGRVQSSSRRSSISSTSTNTGDWTVPVVEDEVESKEFIALSSSSAKRTRTENAVQVQVSKTVNVHHSSQRLAFLPPPIIDSDAPSTLITGLEWLYECHVQHVLQWEEGQSQGQHTCPHTIASRIIYDITHLYCLELARGFFITQLTVMLAALARIKHILHQMGKCLVLFLLEFKESSQLEPVFEYFATATTSIQDDNNDNAWLVELNYVHAGDTTKLKRVFQKVFDGLSYTEDLAPYDANKNIKNQKQTTEPASSNGTTHTGNKKKETTTAKVKVYADHNSVDNNRKATDGSNEDNKAEFNNVTNNKSLVRPSTAAGVISKAKDADVEVEDTGENVLHQAGQTVPISSSDGLTKDKGNGGHGPQYEDGNAMLLAKLSASESSLRKKERKLERQRNTSGKGAQQVAKQSSSSVQTQLRRDNKSSKSAIDDIFASSSDDDTSPREQQQSKNNNKRVSPSIANDDSSERKKKKSKKKSRSKKVESSKSSSSSSSSRHILDDIFDGL
jgi:hypothetical protein